MNQEMENGFRLNKANILKLVKRNGWTNRKLAKLLNISPSAVSMWTTGDRPDTLVLMKAIVRLFHGEPWDALFLRD